MFDKNNSMKLYFYKTGDLNGSNYVGIPLRNSAILNIGKKDENFFIWSMLAQLHPCENSYPTRVSIYKKNFNELSNQVCVFNNGFKCSDSHECEKLNNLSINIFELNFNQDNDKWKPNLLPIEIGTIESDKVIDLLVDKNLLAPIKELNVFLGNCRKISICRRCFTSYTIENRIRNHKEN